MSKLEACKSCGQEPRVWNCDCLSPAPGWEWEITCARPCAQFAHGETLSSAIDAWNALPANERQEG